MGWLIGAKERIYSVLWRNLCLTYPFDASLDTMCLCVYVVGGDGQWNIPFCSVKNREFVRLWWNVERFLVIASVWCVSNWVSNIFGYHNTCRLRILLFFCFHDIFSRPSSSSNWRVFRQLSFRYLDESSVAEVIIIFEEYPLIMRIRTYYMYTQTNLSHTCTLHTQTILE